MTNEELDEARADEGWRIWDEMGRPDEVRPGWIVARLAREGWKPPEPVVDPDVLALRKLLATSAPELADAYLRGDFDNRIAWVVEVYKAGREQEQERAKELVDRLSDLVERVTHDGKQDYVTGVNAGEMISARAALAKYRGEA